MTTQTPKEKAIEYLKSHLKKIHHLYRLEDIRKDKDFISFTKKERKIQFDKIKPKSYMEQDLTLSEPYFLIEDFVIIKKALDIAITETEKQGYERARKEVIEDNEYGKGYDKGYDDAYNKGYTEGLTANRDVNMVTELGIKEARQEGADQKAKEIFNDLRQFVTDDYLDSVISQLKQKHLGKDKEVK